MNQSEFINTGGYRLYLERLNEMSVAYSIFNALGYVAGDKSIIYGCEPNGANTTEGFVFLNGELLSFVGGATQANVKIIEEVTNKEFDDGTVKPVYRKRYVAFASGSNTIAWADFKRCLPTNTLQEALNAKATTTALDNIAARVTKLEVYAAPFAVANGSMVFWRKPANQIPNGWQEVVDWRGRLAIGRDPADSELSTIGAPVGSKTVQLAATNMPTHTISIPKSSAASGGGGNMVLVANNSPNGSLDVSYAGTGTAINILNPARIVMYIEPIPPQ